VAPDQSEPSRADRTPATRRAVGTINGLAERSRSSCPGVRLPREDMNLTDCTRIAKVTESSGPPPGDPVKCWCGN